MVEAQVAGWTLNVQKISKMWFVSFSTSWTDCERQRNDTNCRPFSDSFFAGNLSESTVSRLHQRRVSDGKRCPDDGISQITWGKPFSLTNPLRKDEWRGFYSPSCDCRWTVRWHFVHRWTKAVMEIWQTFWRCALQKSRQKEQFSDAAERYSPVAAKKGWWETVSYVVAKLSPWKNQT